MTAERDQLRVLSRRLLPPPDTEEIDKALSRNGHNIAMALKTLKGARLAVRVTCRSKLADQFPYLSHHAFIGPIP